MDYRFYKWWTCSYFRISSAISILGTLLGTVFGAGIAYFVQNRTQKRTWKREYAVRLAEEVYGQLFKELKWMVFFLEKDEIKQLSFNSWGEIQEDYRYFMVEEVFGVQLDRFFQRVRKYNDTIYNFRHTILPKIIDETGLAVFFTHVNEITPTVRFKKSDLQTAELQKINPDFIECLLSGTHPTKFVMREYPEGKFLSFDFSFGQVPSNESQLEKFNDFWELCMEKKNENETYKFIKDEGKEILIESRKFKTEIIKRIREPWNI